ncbi:MAG TPA: hypothetical protein PKY96_01090 [Flavobacteriales bacterium]|nr:hypothetical protein [Flavobacteriales bacterium]
MGTLLSGKKQAQTTKANDAPLHTNAFIGTWTVEFQGGRRIEYWGEQHRMVLRELSGPFTLQRATLIDLKHNVKVQAHWGGARPYAKVEDLYIPQAGYFHDIWNDSLTATGRTANILGKNCRELWGTSNKRDSSWYWTTTSHPKVFSDLRAWAKWLNKGDLEHLLAFADRNAGAALRVRWSKHEFGPPAGSMEFIAIAPGRVPMPELNLAGALLSEERLSWINNSGTGRLPQWMRAFLGNLPPDSLPLAYTPAPVDRGIPDNRFIGTLTAEMPTQYIGAPDKSGKRDTTLRVARYSYWADARRAVLQLHDPDDEGYIFYAVDLDADVVMASHNEGHGYVIPKLSIATLEEAGLNEFGRGLELEFVPQEKYRTILGRRCELHTTQERFLRFFFFPQDSLVNPIFDMQHWMAQRIGQKCKDLMFFGVAGKPMPFAVNGTTLTNYKPGRSNPPVTDLSRYIVRDHRLERRKKPRAEHPIERVIRIEDLEHEPTAAPDVDSEHHMAAPEAPPPPAIPPPR